MQQNPLNSGNPTPAEFGYIPPPEGDDSIFTTSTERSASSILLHDELTESTAELPMTATWLPGGPEISVPRTRANKEAAAAAIKSMRTNPWVSNPNFLAGFMQVMYELLEMYQHIQFNEAQLDTMIRQDLFAMGKSNAKLAQELKNKEAEEQMVRAIASFINAGVSAWQLQTTISARGKATQEAEKEAGTTEKRKAVEDHIEKVLNPPKPISASESPDQVAPATKLTEVEQQKIDKHKKEMTLPEESEQQIPKKDRDEHARLKKAWEKSEKDKQLKTTELTREKHDIARIRSELLQSVVKGAESLVESNIKVEMGKTEKARIELEAIIKSFQTYDETSRQAKDDAKSSLDRTVDLMRSVLESDTKGHSLRG